MFDALTDGLTYLQAHSIGGFVALFWFVLLFELPRYILPFVSAALFMKRDPDIAAADLCSIGRISLMIAGHNEERAIERCVLGLWEQSLPPDEIIVVSDGSSDGMINMLAELRQRGLISKAHGTALRAGKSAATNLAQRLADGDIMINVDCDCSFDRHALRNIVRPFSDLRVGAVSGNISPRNRTVSIIAAFQAIEYLISISLGKKALGMIGQVSCASGAFSAFRRDALEQVSGLDSGGGEDLDVTLRLRRSGWRIEFADDAMCYTDVPATLTALTRQRFRWERDAVRLRYRKHVGAMNPFSKKFDPAELFNEFEFLLFNVVGAAALPFYCLWLFTSFGDMAPLILIAAQAGMTAIDIIVFALAAVATPRAVSLPLFPYVFGYSLFNGILMRFIRLSAYLQEWIFRSSYSDTYVPDKVHKVRA